MRKKIIIPTIILGLTFNSMGIFSKLFAQKKTLQAAITSHPEKEHSEEWEFYFSNVNDKLASLYVDLGLRELAPIKHMPNLVWVSIKMNNPRKDGLSSTEESDELFKIEDTMVEKLNSKYNSIYAGRVTSDGDRDLYFYFEDTTQYAKSISEVMVAFPKYQFEYGSKEDKNWGEYLEFLFPTPQQYQSITNRRVVDNLEKNGDKLTKPREVDHWIYFKTQADRSSFLSKIKNEGFSIVNKDFDRSLGELPYKLHIKRMDKVDLDSVDEYAIHLWKLAIECNGDYDGWETSVEKE